jgi:hypothetical protein
MFYQGMGMFLDKCNPFLHNCSQQGGGSGSLVFLGTVILKIMSFSVSFPRPSHNPEVGKHFIFQIHIHHQLLSNPRAWLGLAYPTV